MSLNTTLVEYKSIKIEDQELLLEDGTINEGGRISFNSPFNTIKITMQPTSSSLSYFEIRITNAADSYDIGVGVRPAGCYSYNVSANKEHTFVIDVNETNFIHGNGEYRLSLYAKSALDGKWDVIYLVFALDGYIQLSDGSILGVLTDRDAPLTD